MHRHIKTDKPLQIMGGVGMTEFLGVWLPPSAIEFMCPSCNIQLLTASTWTDEVRQRTWFCPRCKNIYKKTNVTKTTKNFVHGKSTARSGSNANQSV